MPTVAEVAVRPVEAQDVEAVQRVWGAAGVGRATPDELEALLSNQTTAILVAEDGSGIVGAAIASFDGWRAYIYHVAVDSAARGRGIASRLMEEAEHYLISAGARYVYVMVSEESADGLALVASAGYLPEGERVFVKRMATRVA